MWRTMLMLVTACAATWTVQGWRFDAQLAAQAFSHQEEMTRFALAKADQVRQALERQQLARQALADLDKKFTQEKSNALAENKRLLEKYTTTVAANDRLRADVAAGHERLRIAGGCRDSDRPMSSTSGAAGLGPAGSIELSPIAGRTVFDIRAGIIADQAALKTLQAYVKTMCQY